MNVVEILKQHGQKTRSIEIEPPSLQQGVEQAFRTIDPLADRIQWVDITYHPQRVQGNVDGKPIYAGRLKPGTVGIAGRILERYKPKIVPVPHVICTSFSQFDTQDYLADLAFLGIETVMALRGDPPKDMEGHFLSFKPEPNGHSLAKELIAQIASLKKGRYADRKEGFPLQFCIGAACFPEGNSDQPEKELDWLKEKVDAGAEYLVTQMFFNTEKYLRFVEQARKSGISIPIIPGLMPLSKHGQLDGIPKSFSCDIPTALAGQIDKHKDNADTVKRIGIEWCVKQCETLLKEGAPSLHFYAARGAPVKEVLEALDGES